MALAISLDCNDLEAQAAFWKAALGYVEIERAELHVGLAPEDGNGPALFLNLVPEPKTVKNRMHLDWDVEDVDAEASRLEDLGARRLHRGEIAGESEWITLQDPEGNEFCVEQPVVPET